MAEETLSNFQIYLFMGIMVITGSINTIANKLMQQTESLGMKFERHQKFITFAMFVGEFFCLAIYYATRKKKPSKLTKSSALLPNDSSFNHQEDKAAKGEVTIEEELALTANKVDEQEGQAKIWYFFFPALCDFFGSTIMSISLTYIATSIYQMFRGTIILFTAMASLIFLKTKFYKYHYIGILIVILGLGLVGLNAVIYSDKGTGSSPVAGIILVIVAQFFSTSMFIVEEKLLKQYNTPALKVVGFEGMWGVCIYIIVMIVSYFISCDSWTETLRKNLCAENEKGETRFEDILFAFRQIGDSVQLICFFLLYIISIAFFNFAGLSVTKYVSSTARTIVDTLRTVVIWLFFLTMPFVPESTKENFFWLQLVGFIILVLGSVIYKKIIVLKFCGLDQDDSTVNETKNNEEDVKVDEEEEVNQQEEQANQ